MHLVDYLVLGVLIIIIVCIVIYMVRRKKRCKGGCGNCPYNELRADSFSTNQAEVHCGCCADKTHKT
ncbi:MAG: hypothetical protein FWD71_06605 [Oscillospiraceae bacterium]|nr:hypothetical protein [Oscillospiraceae bacterium]